MTGQFLSPVKRAWSNANNMSKLTYIMMALGL